MSKNFRWFFPEIIQSTILTSISKREPRCPIYSKYQLLLRFKHYFYITSISSKLYFANLQDQHTLSSWFFGGSNWRRAQTNIFGSHQTSTTTATATATTTATATATTTSRTEEFNAFQRILIEGGGRSFIQTKICNFLIRWRMDEANIVSSHYSFAYKSSFFATFYYTTSFRVLYTLAKWWIGFSPLR